MRHQTQEFLAKFLIEHKGCKKLLEVGSRDVTGNIRNIVEGIDYTASDMLDGPNVDLVINGHDLLSHFGKPTFDMIVCFDTFEHDDKFWLTLENMKQVLLPGGWLLLGIPGRNCPLHEHPGDYYRFMPSAMDVFLKGYEDIFIDGQMDDPAHKGEDEIYGWGRKPL